MQNSENPVQYITVGRDDDARNIGMIVRPAKTSANTDVSGPTLLWLGGYRSDMSGTKAVELDRFADEHGLACIRFDYSGHGVSGGDFTKGTISRWLDETLAVIADQKPQSIIAVGSSMGGWIALRLIQELKQLKATTVDGLVLIAPAPDFTAELIEPNLSEAEKTSLEERGYFEEPSEYSPEPNIFTRALIEDGRENRVLKGMIETGCPVHILQGGQDPDVPYTHALKLMQFLPADDVILTMIQDGDHRLSRPQDIERMLQAVKDMAFSAKPQRS